MIFADITTAFVRIQTVHLAFDPAWNHRNLQGRNVHHAHLGANLQRALLWKHQHFRVGVFPVGIDTERFRRIAEMSMGSTEAMDLEESLAGRALIIGIDRLDYSKGIVHRLDGYERFLEKYPEWHGRVTYLQIAPGSRQERPEYADLDAAVSAKVGHMHGRFGVVSWVPLR